MSTTDLDLEVALETSGLSSTALGLTAAVLEEAATELNNSGISLPEPDWRDVCDRVLWLQKMANTYASAAVDRMQS